MMKKYNSSPITGTEPAVASRLRHKTGQPKHLLAEKLIVSTGFLANRAELLIYHQLFHAHDSR